MLCCKLLGNMTKTIMTLIITMYSCLTYGISIVCVLPPKLDDNTIIAECKVIGYSQNFTSPLVDSTFTTIQVEVTTSVFNEQKLDTFYIAELFSYDMFGNWVGSDDYQLMKFYPIGKEFIFFGNAFEVDTEKPVFMKKDCVWEVKGPLKDKVPYDYEMFRKIHFYVSRIETDTLYVLGDELVLPDQIDLIEIQWEIEYMVAFPELAQAYFDLVELQSASKTKEKMTILRKLVWCNFIDESFIKQQGLRKKHEQELITEFLRIQERWPD